MAEKMISKKNSKEDDVLSIIDEELGKKSKVKKGSSSGSAKAGPSNSTTVTAIALLCQVQTRQVTRVPQGTTVK